MCPLGHVTKPGYQHAAVMALLDLLSSVLLRFGPRLYPVRGPIRLTVYLLGTYPPLLIHPPPRYPALFVFYCPSPAFPVSICRPYIDLYRLRTFLSGWFSRACTDTEILRIQMRAGMLYPTTRGTKHRRWKETRLTR